VAPDAGVDADDPQLAELALALLAIAGGLGHRVQQRLAGGTDELGTGAAAAFRGIEQPLVALVSGDAALDTGHAVGPS
jgi:hypothetical protein